jgi:hypothetical protein
MPVQQEPPVPTPSHLHPVQLTVQDAAKRAAGTYSALPTIELLVKMIVLTLLFFSDSYPLPVLIGICIAGNEYS